MLAYRLCRAPFAALDGEGARRYGGRWNSVGRAVVYAASTRALAALEYLVHVDVADVPADLVLLTLEVPDDAAIARVDAAALPADWRVASESVACRALGDAWVARGDALVLRVPSAAIPEEENVLLDPRAARFAETRVVAARPFAYDPRLVR